MKLITAAQRARLLKNGALTVESDGEDCDHIPVVKLFTPDAQCTWLLCALDPADPDIAFGLCDLGMGYPELGYVSLEEITRARGPIGLTVERDMYCTLKHPISVYANAARQAGRIVLQVAA